MRRLESAESPSRRALRYFPLELQPARNAAQTVEAALFYFRSNSYRPDLVEAFASLRLDASAPSYETEIKRFALLTVAYHDANRITPDIAAFLLGSAIEQMVWAAAHQDDRARQIVDAMIAIREQLGIPDGMDWIAGHEPRNYAQLKIELFAWARETEERLFASPDYGIFSAMRSNNQEELSALYLIGQEKLFCTRMLTQH